MLAGAMQPDDGIRSEPPFASLARLSDASGGLDWGACGHTSGERHFNPLAVFGVRKAGRQGLASLIDLPPGNSTRQLLPMGCVMIPRVIPQIAEPSDSQLSDVRQYILDEAAAWARTIKSGRD